MGLKGTRFVTMEDIECDGRTAEDSKRSLPPVLPTMAGSMEQVCVCVCVCVRARVLLWRWLGERCHMSNHYIGVPHFRELFDCPSYFRKPHWNLLSKKNGKLSPAAFKKCFEFVCRLNYTDKPLRLKHSSHLNSCTKISNQLYLPYLSPFKYKRISYLSERSLRGTEIPSCH